MDGWGGGPLYLDAWRCNMIIIKIGKGDTPSRGRESHYAQDSSQLKAACRDDALVTQHLFIIVAIIDGEGIVSRTSSPNSLGAVPCFDIPSAVSLQQKLERIILWLLIIIIFVHQVSNLFHNGHLTGRIDRFGRSRVLVEASTK